MRAVLLFFIAGSAGVQALAALPSRAMLVALGGLAIAAIVAAVAFGRRWPAQYGPLEPTALRRMHARHWILIWLCVAAVSIGFGLSAMRAQWRLDDALAPEHEGVVTALRVRVVSLPSGDETRRVFDVALMPRQMAGVPSRVRVRWFAPLRGRHSVPVVVPGQVWRMALRLQRPYAGMNPDGPDGAGRLFAAGIRATATVRGNPRLLADEPYSSAMIAIQRTRFVLRERMRAALRGRRYAAVLIALALGDQSGITRDDWQRFGRTGITHLVAISGLHVTLVAGLAAACVSGIWRRMAWRGVALAERLPAPRAPWRQRGRIACWPGGEFRRGVRV